MPGLGLVASVMTVIVSACPGNSIDALFAPYDNDHCPGASVAVIKDGEIVFERAYGIADLETGERATPQTNYRLASVSKQFTATALSLLAQRGALAIDDPVARYLPELASVAPAVTLRHLLMHTSGLPEYAPLLPPDDPRQIADRDVVALLAHPRKVAALPGAAPAVPQPPLGTYHYCNTNYALLATVIERVSGQPYGEFLRRNIFAPLGMTSTTTGGAGALIRHRAYGYTSTLDPDDFAPGRAAPPMFGMFQLSDQNRITAVLGDGGVYSSTRDLAHWIDGLDRHRLLDSKRLAEATSALVPTESADGYGFGWRIGEHNGAKLVFHGGATSGFKNALLWIPSKRLGVVVLTNRREGEPLAIAKQVLDQFWDL